ncbi:AMP-binding protein [Luteolibacter sp. AS25]|uniref:AMP-binding protein n=1 Tax=Luteolibacter sp. AS25 TaxID=3135776 RepID=UPI00398BBBCC
MNLVSLLFENAALFPDRPALIDGKRGADRIVTYRQLADRISSGAAHLHSLGLRQNHTILVFQPVSIELYEILLSAFHSGIRVMLADPSAGRKFISHCCQRTAPDAFFGPWKAQALRLAIPELRRVKTSIRTGPWFPCTHPWKNAGESIPLANVPDTQHALITFTSGSTGLPKAAIRTHGFLLAQHRALSHAMEFRPGEVDLITLPVFVLANLASGMTSVLADTNLGKPGTPDHQAILRQCETFKVTRCAASPAFFQALSHSLPKFEKIYTGGAPVFPDLLAKLLTALPNASIHSVYGSTEAEPIAHLPARSYNQELRQITRSGGGLCTGKPVPEIQLKIIKNQSGTSLFELTSEQLAEIELPSGKPGEIIVSGPHVLPGYLDGIGDSDTKIHLANQIWHRTGDAGYLDEDGQIWLLGRASEKLPTHPHDEKLAYPFAIESALRESFPNTRTAALEWKGMGTLVIENHPDSPKITELAANLGISQIIEIDSIPLDRRHNAKIDYPALRKKLGSH